MAGLSSSQARRERAAVGFTVKSGWAAAVLVTGSPASPRVADSLRIELSDPALPDARQPYHDGFGTARGAGSELNQLLRSVRRFGRKSVAAVLKKCASSGHPLAGAGIVVGSLIDPEKIANDHIRIHALEGRLFRTVVEDAVVAEPLPCSTWCARDLYAAAADALGMPEPRLRATMKALGRNVRGSWRAEQKDAALAAWLMLARRAPRSNRSGTSQRRS